MFEDLEYTFKNIDSLYNFKKFIQKWKPETFHAEFVRFLSKI